VIRTLKEFKDPQIVDPLIQLSKKGQKNIRIEAMQTLKHFNDPRIVKHLIQLLKDKDPQIFCSIAEILGELKDPRAVIPLTKILNAKFTYNTRQRNFRTPVVKDEKTNLRIIVAKSLGHLKDPRAVDPLIQILRRHTDPELFKTDIDALGQIGNPRAVDVLIDRLHLYHKKYRFYRKGEVSHVPSAAVDALSQIQTPQTTRMIIRALKDRDTNVFARAFSVLRKQYDSQIGEVLIKALKDKDDNVQVGAILGLAHLKYTPAKKPLLLILRENVTPQVLQAATMTLGELGEKRAIEQLIGFLKYKDRGVRRTSAKVLGQLKASKALEPLFQLLKDDNEDEYVRAGAAWALGQLGDRQVVKTLIEILNNFYFHSYRIRSQKNQTFIMSIVEALGRLQDQRAGDVLFSILKQEGGMTFKKKKTCSHPLTGELLYTSGTKKNFLFPRGTSIRQTVIKALIALEFISLKPVFKELKSKNGQTIMYAIQALKRLSSTYPQAVYTPLIAILAKKGDSWRGNDLENAFEVLNNISPSPKELELLKPLLLSIILTVSEEDEIYYAKKLLKTMSTQEF
ncbi:MAG: HEAT repeat domain-containing protein, partial [Candidatus Hodarchaeota archaeon]